MDVHASRENLIQLISILFDNAVKYASEGGYIDGSLKKSGRELVLQVKNTCEKLPEVEPEKLFERFYRGDAARTQKSGGYGIGLSAARAIALAHGGTLGASYEKNPDTHATPKRDKKLDRREKRHYTVHVKE